MGGKAGLDGENKLDSDEHGIELKKKKQVAKIDLPYLYTQTTMKSCVEIRGFS